MGSRQGRIGRTDRERERNRLLRWRRITLVPVEAAVSAAPRRMRATRPPLPRVKYAQGKSQRDQRRDVAIAQRKIRRGVQGNFGSARPRPQLARFGEAAPVRLGTESSVSWEMQFPLPRAFSTMGALFG